MEFQQDPRIDLQNNLGRAKINHYSVNSAWGFAVDDFLASIPASVGMSYGFV
jgi:hypothetical protein